MARKKVGDFFTCGKALEAIALQLLLVSLPVPTLILRHDNAARVPFQEDTPTHPEATRQNLAVSFFMHDILDGSAPSEWVVAGTTMTTPTTQLVSTNLSFSKRTKRGVFPPIGGNPLVTAGPTLPSLVFRVVTVIDDEITEGQELGASVLGKAQGFHLATSLDGSSQTMAFTATFGYENDAISFFGVHRTGAPESLIAVVGGTGKYEDASGYATIEMFHLSDRHLTNGVETLLQISVHLAQ